MDEIVVAQLRSLYDGQGRILATLAANENDEISGGEQLALTGDFTGDGVPDILLRLQE